MSIPLTPQECIQEAIWNTIPDLSATMTKEERLHMLSDAVLQFLDAEGFTIIDRDAAWNFHDSLERWLNQDDDEYRLSVFTPHQDWLEVWRRLPPRRTD
jgi:hypothetical protein